MGAPAGRLNDSVLGADTAHRDSAGAPRLGADAAPGHSFSGTIRCDASPDVRSRDAAAAVGRHGGHEQPAAHADAAGRVVPETAIEPAARSASGSSTVTINGKAAARVGDPVRTCNDPTDAGHERHRLGRSAR